jgi:hypothetical protein
MASAPPQEKRDLDNVVDIIKMYESAGEAHDPSVDGFVFQNCKSKRASAPATANT